MFSCLNKTKYINKYKIYLEPSWITKNEAFISSYMTKELGSEINQVEYSYIMSACFSVESALLPIDDISHRLYPLIFLLNKSLDKKNHHTSLD